MELYLKREVKPFEPITSQDTKKDAAILLFPITLYRGQGLIENVTTCSPHLKLPPIIWMDQPIGIPLLSSMLDEEVGYNRCSQQVTFLRFQKRMPMGKRFGKYVFIMYMFTKVLYIANAVVQIFILNSILGK